MPDNDKFLSPLGDYKRLIAFQKSECIYDITYYFIEHYLPMIGDRTVDQMKQAARVQSAGGKNRATSGRAGLSLLLGSRCQASIFANSLLSCSRKS